MAIVERVWVGAQGDEDSGDSGVVVGDGEEERCSEIRISGFDVCSAAIASIALSASPEPAAASRTLSGSLAGWASSAVSIVAAMSFCPRLRAMSMGAASSRCDRSRTSAPPAMRSLTVSCALLVAIAEDDCFVEGGPAEVVDVVDVDVGLEQPPDDVGVSSFGGPDESCAVEAVQRSDVGAVVEGEFEEFEVALAGGDEIGALLGVSL